MKISPALSLIVACTFFAGCAGTPKTPERFDFGRATVVADTDNPVVVIDGASGKGSGAATSGAVGAGAGLGFGTLLCVAAGPWLFVPCLTAVVPWTTASGGIAGAATGAIRAEEAQGVETKQAMLEEALRALDASQRLATLLHEQSRVAPALDPPHGEPPPHTPEAGWTLRVSVDQLATVGSGPEVPYSLRASATVEITRTGQDKPDFVKQYHVLNPLKLTTAEWRADNDAQLHAAVEEVMAALSAGIITDLAPGSLSFDKGLENKGAPAEIGVAGGKGADPANPPGLFDSSTGINWIVIDSPPVTLSTAKSVCKALAPDGQKKYRLPSLDELEQLWQRYKGDERISYFKGREYSTNDEDLYTRSSYTRTFSFATGTSGNLYAAYLACASE